MLQNVNIDSIHRVCWQPTVFLSVLQCATIHIDSIHRVCWQPTVFLSVLQCATIHIDSIHCACWQPAVVLSVLQYVAILIDSIHLVYRQPAAIMSVLQWVTLHIQAHNFPSNYCVSLPLPLSLPVGGWFTGSLFYVTTIVCHFLPLLSCSYGIQLSGLRSCDKRADRKW